MAIQRRNGTTEGSSSWDCRISTVASWAQLTQVHLKCGLFRLAEMPGERATSRETEALKRGTSVSATDIWSDYQFQYANG